MSPSMPGTSHSNRPGSNLAFSGQEHEHVARLVAQLLERPRHLLRNVFSFLSGSIPDLDGVTPALHLDDRRPFEEGAKLLDLQGGGGHDHPQVRTAPYEVSEVTEDEVDVEGPFVRFVDDEGVVGAQVAVALNFREQDAVGHQLDAGIPRGVPLKPHLVAHEPAEPRTELRRDTGRDAPRRDPAGLCMADHRSGTSSGPEADLRELGALARSGGPDHQRDRMLGHRARDVRRPFGDRKVGRNR